MKTSELLKMRPPEDMILTPSDLNLCMGSGELLDCPFCGAKAMSSGEKTENGKAIRWKIQCTGSKSLWPNCMASVIGVDPDQATARAQAVERWNRRTPSPAVDEAREALELCHAQLTKLRRWLPTHGSFGEEGVSDYQDALHGAEAALAKLKETKV